MTVMIRWPIPLPKVRARSRKNRIRIAPVGIGAHRRYYGEYKENKENYIKYARKQDGKQQDFRFPPSNIWILLRLKTIRSNERRHFAGRASGFEHQLRLKSEDEQMPLSIPMSASLNNLSFTLQIVIQSRTRYRYYLQYLKGRKRNRPIIAQGPDGRLY
jgi:hypothetical protein